MNKVILSVITLLVLLAALITTPLTTSPATAAEQPGAAYQGEQPGLQPMASDRPALEPAPPDPVAPGPVTAGDAPPMQPDGTRISAVWLAVGAIGLVVLLTMVTLTAGRSETTTIVRHPRRR